jgi:hypothetical protein
VRANVAKRREMDLRIGTGSVVVGGYNSEMRADPDGNVSDQRRALGCSPNRQSILEGVLRNALSVVS